MSRFLLAFGVLLAALSGCAQPTRVSTGTLPPPLLATRRPPPRRVLPPPPPPERPQPSATYPEAPLSRRELIPRGGIHRGQWQVIVVHHSASDIDTPQSMDNYHRNVRKWSNGLGYHFVIGNGVNTEDGKIYVGPRWRRQIVGAHCKSSRGRYFGRYRPDNYFNEHGIGICLIGNMEKHAPTAKQLVALQQIVSLLCTETGIEPTYVYGHGDVTHKTACPGRYLSRKLAGVRATVSRLLAAGKERSWPPG